MPCDPEPGPPDSRLIHIHRILRILRDAAERNDTAPLEDIIGVTRISFADERAGWLLAEANRERHTLLRTRDGGESWERLSFPAEVLGR